MKRIKSKEINEHPKEIHTKNYKAEIMFCIVWKFLDDFLKEIVDKEKWRLQDVNYCKRSSKLVSNYLWNKN